MKRRGIVAAINANRGMVALQTDDDGYTIIEILSDFELSIGDEIAWANGYGLGGEAYENLSTGELAEVFVQNHSVGPAALRAQMLL